MTSANLQIINSIAPPPIKTYKVIVLGNCNVGKTALTYRFCERSFIPTSPTIGVDFREKIISTGDEDVKLQLWDTAGEEKFRKSMISHYYRNVHAVIFVYDVTNLESFQSLTHWITECNDHIFEDIPRILVGNKCDETAAVGTNTGLTFADEHHMPFFETSAKDNAQGETIDGIFLTLAHKLKSQKPLIKRPQTVQLSITNNVDNHTKKSTSYSCCY